MSSYLKWLSRCNINKFPPKADNGCGEYSCSYGKSENQWVIVNPGKIKKGLQIVILCEVDWTGRQVMAGDFIKYLQEFYQFKLVPEIVPMRFRLIWIVLN